MSDISTKPYLIRAIYEWCIDQGYTPYVAAMVDTNTRVPPGSAKDGQIVLNVSPDATHQLDMSNDVIRFQARFGGVAHALSIPVANVIAIYARENGQGMAFEVTAVEDEVPSDVEADPEIESVDAPEPPDDGAPGGGGRGHLKVVK
ncbi:ClpXP protease specificity-enhancing factor [Nitrogeniibacter mangrovi]|uniref:ClpXP protease specificity-enhancing factor n=1 Tax=Nitrogeniibacter mangrovi TaxID=2016596 RepID=A0A6C1B4E0_9RHOO|nr:ClpXP protease specificity-enhancing factor [Nitrogeniibacter mangrovi]QID18561.1 ClpXP protease specificity-enhancing factor [Nitrogeniibacter mangrovi]